MSPAAVLRLLPESVLFASFMALPLRSHSCAPQTQLDKAQYWVAHRLPTVCELHRPHRPQPRPVHYAVIGGGKSCQTQQGMTRGDYFAQTTTFVPPAPFCLPLPFPSAFLGAPVPVAAASFSVSLSFCAPFPFAPALPPSPSTPPSAPSCDTTHTVLQRQVLCRTCTTSSLWSM
jgi:hypothetical protein